MNLSNQNDSIKFLVQGSSDDPYEVSFWKDGNRLSAFCTCSAGQNGQHCKHRMQIFDGITDGIVSGNGDQVPAVVSWLSGTEVAAAIDALNAAERELDRAKKAVASSKKHLAAAMR